jgi:5'-phosphate synthase pdxT subunit
MNASVRVGVLALQGASEPHRAAFARLRVDCAPVRAPEELDGLTHLVLPGGESTTLHHLLTRFGLWERIRVRARSGTLALFGTCAGAILLARTKDGSPPTLGCLEATLERNAYGTQRDSFARDVSLEGEPFPGVFIRAPRIVAAGPAVRVLADLEGEPVALEAPGLLATTFHPELTADARLHERFLTSPTARVSCPASGADPRA